MKILSFIALLSMATPLWANEITLNNGTVFDKVKIVKTTPIGVDFVSGGSAGWADFRDMPDVEAKALGYDPAKAAEFEKKLQANQGSALTPDASPAAYVQNSELNIEGNAPQTPENTVLVTDNDSIPYDTTVVCGAPSPQWINWNGHVYPYNVWHHWYWNHHWVYYNGRYVPAHYFHHQYLRHDGHYYHYKHNLLPKPEHPHRSPGRPGGHRFEHHQHGGIHRDAEHEGERGGEHGRR